MFSKTGIFIVDKVYYPGFEDHPGYEIHKKQANEAGAIILFILKEDFNIKSGVNISAKLEYLNPAVI
ncbi:PLP-dependent transferase [Clostridium thailandense]|uniref:PLP-dependent transferase n=1 Tax=Clostridium thailandense TaxID=2794346 RepID=UPI003988A5E8